MDWESREEKISIMIKANESEHSEKKPRGINAEKIDQDD